MNHRLLGKLIRLQRREWADLLMAQAALVRAQLEVWLRPRGTLVTPNSSHARDDAASAPARVERLALAVARAAQYGLFRPRCLVRAVALYRMLQARGFSDAALCVGVRRESANFVAHAWVEYRGAVLADQEWYVKGFDELTRMGVARAP